MTDRPDERLERLYARAEEKNEQRKTATVRRGPIGLVAVCIGVALAVGVTAAVDLRRLNTPRGTAEAWVGAAVFGECTTYRRLSFPEFEGDQPCRELRDVTEDARERPDEVALEVLEVLQDGDAAVASVRVGRDDDERDVVVSLRRVDGDWRVWRNETTCASFACP